MFIIAYNISNIYIYIYGLIIIDGIDLQINITQHCSEVKKAVILLISPPLSFFCSHIKQRKTKVFLFHPIDRNYEKKAIYFCQYICNIRYKESFLDAIALLLKIKNGITKNKNLYILTIRNWR